MAQRSANAQTESSLLKSSDGFGRSNAIARQSFAPGSAIVNEPADNDNDVTLERGAPCEHSFSNLNRGPTCVGLAAIWSVAGCQNNSAPGTQSTRSRPIGILRISETSAKRDARRLCRDEPHAQVQGRTNRRSRPVDVAMGSRRTL
jgi:hypothetical protein